MAEQCARRPSRIWAFTKGIARYGVGLFAAWTVTTLALNFGTLYVEEGLESGNFKRNAQILCSKSPGLCEGGKEGFHMMQITRDYMNRINNYALRSSSSYLQSADKYVPAKAESKKEKISDEKEANVPVIKAREIKRRPELDPQFKG